MIGKIAVALVLNVFGFLSPADAAEFREKAMCHSSARNPAFPRISIQTFPGRIHQAILILTASDGWTQVYSGPYDENTKRIKFNEDQGTIEAEFDKQAMTATISFNDEPYKCDERSFGDQSAP